MELWELLDIQTGVTAVIGAGGKSTTLQVLASELRRRGRVICCTTTHFFPLEGMPLVRDAGEEALAQALQQDNAVCLGDSTSEGKLGTPRIPMDRLRELADYVLVEADGSKRLPCKAHREYEPVIPPEASQTILLVGASGFGRPICEAAHRPELFCPLSGTRPEDPITPEALAAVIRAEGYGDKIFVNQAETPERLHFARQLAALLEKPVYAGSLQGRKWECLS